MNPSIDKARWIYRFENYERAFFLLKEALATKAVRPLNALEQEGTIQRFEYTWELAWKTLKDYLEDMGVVLETITPAGTIKAAFAAKIIEKGDVWMRALDARNKMSHTYNVKIFEKTIEQIDTAFFPILNDMYQKLFSLAQECFNE